MRNFEITYNRGALTITSQVTDLVLVFTKLLLISLVCILNGFKGSLIPHKLQQTTQQNMMVGGECDEEFLKY